MSEMPSRDFIRRGKPLPFDEPAWPLRAAGAVLALHLVAALVAAAYGGPVPVVDFISP